MNEHDKLVQLETRFEILRDLLDACGMDTSEGDPFAMGFNTAVLHIKKQVENMSSDLLAVEKDDLLDNK